MSEDSSNAAKDKRFTLDLKGIIASDEAVLSDLRRVATEYGKGTASYRLYRKHGNHDSVTVAKRFGSWNNALSRAGLSVAHRINLSDEQLFENLERVWMVLGRQPRGRDMAERPSKISEGPYVRRFGSWNKALVSFVKYVDDGALLDNQAPLREGPANSPKKGRDVNLRLRFRVMQRDSFKCRKCGRSPATDPSIVLHVDHMKPYSKDGPTIIENLETLCSDCNLGKSNVEF